MDVVDTQNCLGSCTACRCREPQVALPELTRPEKNSPQLSTDDGVLDAKDMDQRIRILTDVRDFKV